MNIYDRIIGYLQEETKKDGLWIDLTNLFKESKLSFNEFNDVLQDLQNDEGLLEFKSSIISNPLQPIKVFVGVFQDIQVTNFGTTFAMLFEAKLTFKGIKYKIEE